VRQTSVWLILGRCYSPSKLSCSLQCQLLVHNRPLHEAAWTLGRTSNLSQSTDGPLQDAKLCSSPARNCRAAFLCKLQNAKCCSVLINYRSADCSETGSCEFGSTSNLRFSRTELANYQIPPPINCADVPLALVDCNQLIPAWHTFEHLGGAGDHGDLNWRYQIVTCLHLHRQFGVHAVVPAHQAINVGLLELLFGGRFWPE
jgi:hypothetical protein